MTACNILIFLGNKIFKGRKLIVQRIHFLLVILIYICYLQIFSQYKWRAESLSGLTLDLDAATNSTGRYSPNLVLRSGVLQPGVSYTFTVNVSLPGTGQWGSASLSLLPNSPPHGGLCDLSPQSDIHVLETEVTFSCSGNRVPQFHSHSVSPYI